MSKVETGKFYIEPEAIDKCEYCGKDAELRPYGKDGAKICFSCGMKNAKETHDNYQSIIAGVTEVVVTDTRTITAVILPKLEG